MISRSEPLRRRNIRRGFHTVCLRGNAYCGALRRIQAGTRSVPNTTLPRRPWERDSDGVGALFLVPTLCVGTHIAALCAASRLGGRGAPQRTCPAEPGSERAR